MAAKTPTYLQFDGGANHNVVFQGPNAVNTTGDLLVTFFVRLLEWPVSNALIWQARDTVTDQAIGMFWYADQFADDVGGGRQVTGDEFCLGVQWPFSTGPTVEDFVGTSTGVPLRLGAVHQIQMAMKYNSGDSKTYVAVFIDGTSVYQSNATGTIHNISPSAGKTMRWGGDPVDNFLALADFERANMDIIQWRWEVDRGLTITSGEIDAPDGVLDFNDELELNSGVDTGKSSAYFLGAGTGNVVADEGATNTGNNAATWADEAEADPQVSVGSASWTFDNIMGYDVRESDSPDAMPYPDIAPLSSRANPTAGRLKLRLLPCIWKEHGDVRPRDWSTVGNAVGSQTAHIVEGTINLKTSNSGGVSSSRSETSGHGGVGAAAQGRWYRGYFYDSGDTSSNMQQRFAMFDGNALEFALGVNVSDSSGNYVVRTDSDTSVDTGVSRSTGLHEFAIFASRNIGLSDMDVRFYIDGVEVHEELATTPGDVQRFGFRHRAESAAEEGHWDWLSGNVQNGDTPSDFQGLVPASASPVLPVLVIPEAVSEFLDVTILDETAGDSSQEVGSTSYSFRHSTDGGSTWGSPTTLNDSNLQALTPAGLAGMDAIEITPTLTAGMDNMGTPAVDSIALSWSPKAPRADHHRRLLMAGA